VRFAFGAGGTGGHIIPAIALADELTTRGHECIFIGNHQSMEERLAAESDYAFYPIQVQKLYRKLSYSNLLFPYHLVKSIAQSRRILLVEEIDGVITTGGFVAGPVSIAAIRLNIPCFLHESNSYPGLTTRFLAKKLTSLYISFDETRKYLKRAELKNFGIPIKNRDRVQDFRLEDVGLESGEKTLLVSGGSQGSMAINRVISDSIPMLKKAGWQMLWQTGKLGFEQFDARHKAEPGVHIFAFSSLLPAMMQVADLAITRAGAMTIAELEAATLPAILIPLPTAAENHQYHNALAQTKKQVARLMTQDQLSPRNLLHVMANMNIPALKNELIKLPENQATQYIVSDILSCYKEK
jgi:UDP-N-acetylglucosamine--N-acetylmuramyl-(pentapeptide) pyrophosphoryl-undecaprenol N-acetylglucosamine transferase